MEKGKSALKSEKYEEAITQFKNALIEKPQDTDAKLLLTQSEEEYNTEMAIKGIKEYLDLVNPPISQVAEITKRNRSIDIVTEADLESQLNELGLIDQQLREITSKFKKNPKINDLQTLFVKSVDEYASATTQMIELLPILKENAQYEKEHPNQMHAIPRVGEISSMNYDFDNALSDFATYIQNLNELSKK